MNRTAPTNYPGCDDRERRGKLIRKTNPDRPRPPRQPD